MKIGILTQPLHNNYGGILQAYALQQVLKDMGHEVYTIDRKSAPISIYRKCGSLVKRALLKISGEKIRLRGWQTKKEFETISQNTRLFINKHIQRTNTVTTTKKIKQFHKEYSFDAYIVGSDQVWRPKYSPLLSNYFFDFLVNDRLVRKIAYAASFGVDNWEFTSKQTRKCSELAQKFDAISVRENSGVQLCEKYLKVEATHLLDPTLLLTPNHYSKLIEIEKTSDIEGNLMCYILDPSTQKNKLINTVSTKLNLKAFTVMPDPSLTHNNHKNISKCIYPPITQWLKGIRDSKFVITDSFHGTIFSIIFNKQFIAIGNKKRGLTRFSSLLKIFNLEDRLIEEESQLDDGLLNTIDYNQVNAIKAKWQKKSMEFLTRSLK